MVEPFIGFDEVLRDSPKFRECLQKNEHKIDDFEVKIERVVKTCMSMVEQGRVYNNATKQFFDSLAEIGKHFDDDTHIKGCIGDIVKLGRDLIEFGFILVDHSERSFAKTLTNFIKDDVKKLKEVHSAFAKISSELDGSLQRHAQLPKNKSVELEETGKLLTANRTCFQHTALEYVGQLSRVQAAKRHKVMEALLGQMNAVRTYHSQALKTFSEHEAPLEDASRHFAEMRGKYERDCMSLSKFTQFRAGAGRQVPPEVESYLRQVTGDPHIPTSSAEHDLEGYLFKRTTNAFKTWNRRWFVLKKGSLYYIKRDGDPKDVTVVERDLRLCTVREVLDGERRFCFEVLSPQKSHVLQADSEKAQKMWVDALKQGINNAHNQNGAHVTRVATSAAFLAVPGNERCADCGASNPEWASLNLGVTLCIQCSGIHRSLGVHISKVRSLKLDLWEDDTLRIMERLGNAAVNKVFACDVDESRRAQPDSERSFREQWIRAKYLDRQFICPLLPPTEVDGGDGKSRATRWAVARLGRRCASTEGVLVFGEDINRNCTSHCPVPATTAPCIEETSDLETFPISELTPSRLLYEAAGADNLTAMLHALALNAEPNYRCEGDRLRTALHKAIADGPWVAAAEFLLLNGAQHTVVDLEGLTPLHLASRASSVALVGLLLKKGANRDALDREGHSALDLAVANGNAEVVTLIRLDRFRDDLKLEGSDFSSDVFDRALQDFSRQGREPDKTPTS